MVSLEHIEFFKTLLGDRALDDKDTCQLYGSDETEDLNFPPGIVLKPKTTEEVAQILAYCHAHYLPVTPAGARTGLSGGALPHHHGVLMSMEKFNSILHIDQDNFQVTTEPGVITEVLQNALKEKGLFYPPDPASRGSCFIGGNIAENSGGPKAVKYGVTKDYVLNLEVVLPTGEVIWTGANVLKNATGYNLTQLMVGSEGTLGVVTKIVLRLLSYPTKNMLMLVPFKSNSEACRAVSCILNTGVTPSGLEFMEREAILYTQQFINDFSLKVEENDQAHLLIEVDGFDEDKLFDDCQIITQTLEQFSIGEILFAESEAQKTTLWNLRRKVGEAVKSQSIYKEEDTVVPRYKLPDLLESVKRIGTEYGFRSVCYGHAGDGNLHINILKENISDEDWHQEIPKAIRALFIEVVALGGTISGEHGIGLVQKPYISIACSDKAINLMKGIKQVFDPHNILNPEKIF